MILTTCAACAAPLAHNAPRCVRCKLRYYAEPLYLDTGATLDDLREAVTTLEDMQRNARRVLGGTHPMTAGIGHYLQKAQGALLTRQGVDMSAVCAALDAMKAT